jgi:hypothetical protein
VAILPLLSPGARTHGISRTPTPVPVPQLMPKQALLDGQMVGLMSMRGIAERVITAEALLDGQMVGLMS